MVKKSIWPMVGAWLFVIGLILALIGGLAWPGQVWVPILLGVIGVIVGLVNITDKETTTFLIAAIAFNVAASNLNSVALSIAGSQVGGWLVSVFTNAQVFVAPAAGVVAIKALYELARSE